MEILFLLLWQFYAKYIGLSHSERGPASVYLASQSLFSEHRRPSFWGDTGLLCPWVAKQDLQENIFQYFENPESINMEETLIIEVIDQGGRTNQRWLPGEHEAIGCRITQVIVWGWEISVLD
jgi:hypothetical protein